MAEIDQDLIDLRSVFSGSGEGYRSGQVPAPKEPGVMPLKPSIQTSIPKSPILESQSKDLEDLRSVFTGQQTGIPKPPAPVPIKEPATFTGEIGKGLMGGLYDIKSMAGGAVAMGGKAIGLEGVEKYGSEMMEAAKVSSEPYTPEVGSYRDIKDAKDLGLYITHGIARMTPNLAATIIPAILTGGIGGAAMGLGKTAVAAKLAGLATREAGEAYLKSVALKRTGMALAGGMAGSLPMEVGQIAEMQKESGQDYDPVKALWAIPAALLDVLPQAHALKRLGVIDKLFGNPTIKSAVKDVTEKVPGFFSKNIVGRVLKQAGIQTLEEAPTEGTQAIIERWGAGNYKFDREALDDFVNSFILGGVTGAFYGGMGGVFPESRGGAKGEPVAGRLPPTPTEPVVGVQAGIPTQVPEKFEPRIPTQEGLYTGETEGGYVGEQQRAERVARALLGSPPEYFTDMGIGGKEFEEGVKNFWGPQVINQMLDAEELTRKGLTIVPEQGELVLMNYRTGERIANITETLEDGKIKVKEIYDETGRKIPVTDGGDYKKQLNLFFEMLNKKVPTRVIPVFKENIPEKIIPVRVGRAPIAKEAEVKKPPIQFNMFRDRKIPITTEQEITKKPGVAATTEEISSLGPPAAVPGSPPIGSDIEYTDNTGKLIKGIVAEVNNDGSVLVGLPNGGMVEKPAPEGHGKIVEPLTRYVTHTKEEAPTVSPSTHGTNAGTEGAFKRDYANEFGPEGFADRSYWYAPGQRVEPRFQGRMITKAMGLNIFEEKSATPEQLDAFNKKRNELTQKFRNKFGENFGSLPQQAQEIDYATARDLGYDGLNQGDHVGVFKEVPRNIEGFGRAVPKEAVEETLEPMSPSGRTTFNVNGDIFFDGKEPKDFTDKDWEAFGKDWKVPNLGPLSKIQIIKGEKIPGGTRGKFTYFDLLYLKWNPPNVESLKGPDHVAYLEKVMRTLTSPRDSMEVLNRFVWSLLTANTGMLPSQFTYMRMKLNSIAGIQEMADLLPDNPTQDDYKDVNRILREKYNIKKGERGSTGITTTVDLSYIPGICKLWLKNRNLFFRGKNETWFTFVDRISTQVRGLGTKTAALGAVYQDPLIASIAAIDTHMVALLKDRIMANPEARALLEDKIVNKFNSDLKIAQELDGHPRKQFMLSSEKDVPDIMATLPPPSLLRADNLDSVIKQLSESDANLEYKYHQMADNYIISAIKKAMDPIKDSNFSASFDLAVTKFIEDPKKRSSMSRVYEITLDEMIAEAKANGIEGLEVFPTQWVLWEIKRGIIDPHEHLFPGLYKLPHMSLRQSQEAFETNQEKFSSQSRRTFGQESLLSPTLAPSELGYFKAEEPPKPGSPLRGNMTHEVVVGLTQRLANLVNPLIARFYAVRTMEELRTIVNRLGVELDPNTAYYGYTVIPERGGGPATVFVVSDLIKTPVLFDNTAWHELSGHVGIERLFYSRPDFNKFMDKVYNYYVLKNPSDLSNTAVVYRADVNTVEGRRLAAKEQFAHDAEKNPRQGIVKEFIALMRRIVRIYFPNLSLSETEIISAFMRGRALVTSSNSNLSFPSFVGYRRGGIVYNIVEDKTFDGATLTLGPDDTQLVIRDEAENDIGRLLIKRNDKGIIIWKADINKGFEKKGILASAIFSAVDKYGPVQDIFEGNKESKAAIDAVLDANPEFYRDRSVEIADARTSENYETNFDIPKIFKTVTANQGGFTINLRTGEADTEGWVVAPSKKTQVTVPVKLSEAAINKFIEDWKHVFRVDREAKLGGWSLTDEATKLPTGEIMLDVSRNIGEDLETAVYLGDIGLQKAIFHIQDLREENVANLVAEMKQKGTWDETKRSSLKYISEMIESGGRKGGGFGKIIGKKPSIFDILSGKIYEYEPEERGTLEHFLAMEKKGPPKDKERLKNYEWRKKHEEGFGSIVMPDNENSFPGATPDDTSEFKNRGAWGQYVMAREGRDKNFANEIKKDMGIYEYIWQLPHWVAMKFKEFAGITNVEWDRLDKMNADRVRLMMEGDTDLDNAFLALKDVKGLEPIIVYSDSEDVYMDDDNVLQNKARGLIGRELTAEEVGAYHSWKGAFDKAKAYITEKAKNILDLRMMTAGQMGLLAKSVADGNTKIEEVKFDNNKDQKSFNVFLTEYQENIKKISDLKKKLDGINFYMPRIRENGDYVVRAYSTDEKGIERAVFADRRESAIQAEKLRLQLLSDPAYSNLKILKTKENITPEFLFEGINQNKIEAFLERSVERAQRKEGLTSEEAQTILDSIYNTVENEILARGFRETYLRRVRLPGGAPIAGYKTEGLKSVFMNYMSGLAGSMNKLEATFRFHDAMKEIDKVKQPNLFEYAHRYQSDMLRNSDNVTRMVNKMKSLPYAWYLMANVRMVAAQLFQNYITGAAILSGYRAENKVGAGATRRISKAMLDVATGNTTDEEKRVLNKAFLEGETTANMVNEMKGRVEGGWAAKVQKVVDVLSIPFSGMEKLNRQTAILAAYRLGREQGLIGSEAYDRAKQFVRDAHYAYGKSNMPQLLRDGTTFSQVAGGAYTFRSFTHNYILSMMHYARTADGKLAIGVVGRSLAFTIMLGGLAAAPFLDDILDGLERLTGENYRSQIRKSLNGIGGEALAMMGMSGVPTLIGVDLSGTVKITPPIPFIGQGTSNSVWGVWGGLADKGSKAIDSALNGNWAKAIESAAPTGLESPLKAFRGATEGVRGQTNRVIVDEMGRPVKLTTGESIAQTLAMRPARVAALSSERRVEANVETYFTEKRKDIYSNVRVAKTPDDWAKVMRQVQTFNVKAMGYRGAISPITMDSIRNSMKTSMKYPKYAATLREEEE